MIYEILHLYAEVCGLKLDGVAPLKTDSTPTSFTTLSERKETNNVTCDM